MFIIQITHVFFRSIIQDWENSRLSGEKSPRSSLLENTQSSPNSSTDIQSSPNSSTDARSSPIISRSVQRSPNVDDCVQISFPDVPSTPYVAKSNPKPGDVAKPQIHNYLKRSTTSSKLVQSHPTLCQQPKSGPTLSNEPLVLSNLPETIRIQKLKDFPKFTISKIQPPLPKISSLDLKPKHGPVTSTPKTVGKKVFIPLAPATLSKKFADKNTKSVGNISFKKLDSPKSVGNSSPVVGKKGSAEILVSPIRHPAIDIAKNPSSVRKTKTGKTFWPLVDGIFIFIKDFIIIYGG